MLAIFGNEITLDGYWNILIAVIILVWTLVVIRIEKRILDAYFKKSSKLINVDPTNYSFLKHVLAAITFIIGVALAVQVIPELRTLSFSLFAGAGVLAVIFGFASQQAFSNIVAGIFIVVFKPFRVGDRIKVKEEISGVVEDITLRHTVIKNFENIRIIVPNSIMSDKIVENFDIHDSRICKFIEFGISYESDLDKAMKIMQEEAEKHPLCIDARTSEEKSKNEPKVVVRVIEIQDSGILLRAYAWAGGPSRAFRLGCDLRKCIKQRFDKEGIEIPYPHRTITFKTDKKTTIEIAN